METLWNINKLKEKKNRRLIIPHTLFFQVNWNARSNKQAILCQKDSFLWIHVALTETPKIGTIIRLARIRTAFASCSGAATGKSPRETLPCTETLQFCTGSRSVIHSPMTTNQASNPTSLAHCIPRLSVNIATRRQRGVKRRLCLRMAAKHHETTSRRDNLI